MKSLSFIAVAAMLLTGCGVSNDISSLNTDTIESLYGPIREINIDIIGNEGSSLKVSGHTLESFNGVYNSQSRKINNKLWYKNENNRYMYHYNQAEGGEKSWSLDHRIPDGTKDWFSGGWTKITEAEYPEEGINDLYSVDQALLGVVIDGDFENVKIFIDDKAKINPKMLVSEVPMTFITPLDIAIAEGHDKIADLLRKHGGKTGEELKAASN